jgi:hypothetical protein
MVNDQECLVENIRFERGDAEIVTDKKGRKSVRITNENPFDWAYHRHVINYDQWQAGRQYMAAWEKGVVSMWGPITMSYNLTTNSDGSIPTNKLNVTESIEFFRKKYYHLRGSLEPVGANLLDKMCEGFKPCQIIKTPKYYANTRLKEVLDILINKLGLAN